MDRGLLRLHLGCSLVHWLDIRICDCTKGVEHKSLKRRGGGESYWLVKECARWYIALYNTWAIRDARRTIEERPPGKA